MMLPPDSDKLRGGASTTSLPALQLFGMAPSRIYLNPQVKGGRYKQVGFISAPTAYQLPPSNTVPIAPWLPSALLLAVPELGPFSIFTYGSWSPTGPFTLRVIILPIMDRQE